MMVVAIYTNVAIGSRIVLTMMVIVALYSHYNRLSGPMMARFHAIANTRSIASALLPT